MAYGCQIPPLIQEREHHILVGAPNHSFGVGHHRHVQLGSAALAWLYRSLCDRVYRSGPHANLGGCAYLLQIWMWEHFSVARPNYHDPLVCTHLPFFIIHNLC
jgi:hypothetical protein